MTALATGNTSFHMVAAAPSGSADAYKACTTYLSLHREQRQKKLTADSHTHRIVTERSGNQRR